MTNENSNAAPIESSVLSVINELLPLFRKFVTGKYAIALGGSLAKGKGDKHSDIDIYLFAHGVVSLEERIKLVKDFAGDQSNFFVDFDFQTSWWGTVADFDFKNYRIESTIRSVERVEKVISDCRAGVIENIRTSWNPYGFYNYVYLSDIESAYSLEDSSHILSAWKSQVASYPHKLKSAIVARSLEGTKFWLDNFHYLSAIQRDDFLYTSGIVQGSLHHLIQILFAINDKYYVGDKKNLEAVQEMKLKPEDFKERVKVLLATTSKVDVLEKQREVLKALVSDVEKLVAL
ncbi:MAG TPA: nucleotidyltransferase domain-containing protein [bacterium]|jgi:hypothetical protein|nr:nucleotidyltransferase domain-containing protein [bacterium]